MCLLRTENVSLMHVWCQGGKEERKELFFFFVWVANKREIKRKIFTFFGKY